MRALLTRLACAVTLALFAAPALPVSLHGYAGGAALNLSLTEQVAVPDCTSSPTAQATCVSAVEGAGFTTSILATCSATVASGDVVSTAPAAGATADAGSNVVLRVSNGEDCGVGSGRRIGIGLGLGVN